jgi:peptidoglycan/xylan/chitin deacetylase (PgdA/CDA1 family)
MERHGFTGTVFLVSDHLGGANEWDIKLGEKFADLMSRETILKLLNQGFEFGSHTMTHVHLDQVDDGVQRLEIEKSKADLESALGVPMNVFCYPYGGLNDSAMKLVQEAGYSCAVSTRKGLNTRDTNRFCLNRIAVRNDTLLPVFVYKLWRAFRYGR